MGELDRLNLHRHIGKAITAFADIETNLERASLEANLGHLVRLRASQMNGCAFCVAMHIEEARRDGETAERIDRVVVWREVDDFTNAERAAFAWTEKLTALDNPRALPPIHDELKRHYTDEEVAALTLVIFMINVWNRMHIASQGGVRDREDPFDL